MMSSQLFRFTVLQAIWGVLSVGLFGDIAKLDTGLTRLQQIGVQTLGALSIVLFIFVVAWVLAHLLARTVGVLRVSP
jgi:Amt family ammonium transporter